MAKSPPVLFDAMCGVLDKFAADADLTQLNDGRVHPGGRFVCGVREEAADQPLSWARCAFEPIGPSAASAIASQAPTWLASRTLRQDMSVTSCETMR